MAFTQPMMLQALCYTATDFRNQLASLVCGEGVADLLDGSLLVTTGGSGLDLSIAEGPAFIDSDVDDEGMYSVFNDAPETVTATAADGTNPRIDQVIATVNDSQILGVDDDWVLSVLAGTPTPGATLSNLSGAATLPDRSIRLAYILVPAGFAGPFVNATHILDARNRFELCSGTPYVELQADAATSIPTGAYTKITLNTLVHVDRGYFTIAASVVTVLQAGLYRCNAVAMDAGGTAGNRYFAISKNGTTDRTPGEAGMALGSAVSMTVGGPPVRLAANDTIQLVGFQTGQANLSTLHNANNISRLSIYKVG